MLVFVLPFFLDQTLRFVAGAVAIPGARVALISQDPLEKLPGDLRDKIVGHWKVDDVFDPALLRVAIEQLAGRFGEVHSLMGTLEQLQVPLAETRESLGLSGVGVETARNFRDKSRMKDVLRSAGLPCARHSLVGTASDALEFVARVGLPLVAKPPDGAGAIGTFRLNNLNDLHEYLERYTPEPGKPALFEEFVSGEEFSFDSVYIRGKPVWHSISRYLPAPLVVMENPWIQWTVLLPRDIGGPEYDDIRDSARRAHAALGLATGLTHMEWFRKSDGEIAISEVGVRPPGAQITSLMSYAHDVNFYHAWPRLIALEKFAPPARKYAAGAAYVRGQGHGRVTAIHGLAEAQKEFGDLVVEAKLPQRGQPRASSYEGDGYVIVRHPDTSVVAHALQRIVETIRVELG